MGRDTVIQIVGSVINRIHWVDLKNYDVMILVETVKVLQPSAQADIEYHWDQCRSGLRQIEEVQC